MHVGQIPPVSYHSSAPLNPIHEVRTSRDSPGSDRSLATSRVYERTRIYTLAVERETVQKKTFTKWANTYLRRSGIEITDLFIDLRDGKILLRLLEILSGEPMPLPTLGRMRIHCLENVDKSLYFLSNLNVHLENVGAHDIVDGNARITLGLLWTIILRFQIQDIAISTTTVDGLGARSRLKRYSKDALLLWCQMKTAGYPDVDVQNFTTSWRDGLAFNALIHKHRPDLINFASLSPNTPLQNLESAFLVAERQLGITRLFDPEDIYVEQPDEKSILTYVVTYYHYFSKVKSDTVHARRVTNFLNYLQDVHDQACLYEKDTSALLAWIRRTTAWLDSRDFPPRVEQLQQLLAQFDSYRLNEKPEKFTEKGNIEMNLFTLQAKMRAVNMRIYKPANGFQVAQVNSAWQMLEKSEHARELALRDELMLQRRLEHLYNRFQRKAQLREAWILDNQKLLKHPDYADDLLMVEAALKKHEALETDVCSYADRIITVSQIADELDRSNFYKAKEVLATREHIEKLWAQLLNMMRERFARLDAKQRHFKQFSELDYLMTIIDSLQKQLEVDDYGSHLSAVEELLQRHELLETDIRSIHRSMSHALRLFEGDANKSDQAAEISKHREQTIRAAYSKLIATAESRRNALELSRLRWEVFAELDEQLYYIRERLNYMKTVREIPNNGYVEGLFRRHRATEIELENRRIALNQTFEKASFLADQKFPDINQVVDRVLEAKEAWEKLIEETIARKKSLMFVRDYQYFLVSCDDTESWIQEKLQLTASVLQRGVQNDSLTLIEGLLKRHQETIAAVDDYASAVDQLKNHGEELLEQADDHLFADTEYPNGQIVAGCENRDQMRENVHTRLQTVTDLYKQLTSEICHTQTSLLDALSLHQLFRMASTAYNWITEKREYLKAHVIDELQDIHMLGRQGDQAKHLNLMQEKMEVVKKRFVELQMQMSKTAEQVSCINRLSTGLLEGPQGDRNSLLNDESTVDRVVSMQDHLNLAWNRLADSMESVKERIVGDSTLLDLCNECKYASDWIKDKEEVLRTIDRLTASGSSGAQQGQIQLRILQGDLRAIEACVEDIDSRVNNTVRHQQEQQQAESVKSPAPDLPAPLSRDFLLKRHMSLVKQWADLQEEVKNRSTGFAGIDRGDPTLEKLDTFQAWLEELKTQLLCGECPNDLQETERRLLAQERYMQEIENYEPQVEQLLSAGYALARDKDESARVSLTHRLTDLEEDWNAIKQAVLERGAALRKRYSLQYFFSEASLLDVLLNQQAAFLAKDEIPTVLDPLRECLRQQEAFASSLGSCSNRVGKLLDLGIKVAQEDTNSSVRVLSKCEAIEAKYDQNCKNSQARTSLLRERVQLHEFFNEVDDLEDWILDKKSALRGTEMAIKRHPRSALDKIRAIEVEIESSRDRGDRVIELGQQIAQQHPNLDDEVKARLEQLHNSWDELLSMVRGLMQYMADENKEKSMEELLQKTSSWLDRKLKETSSPDTSQRTVQPLPASSLLGDLDAHEKNVKEFVECQAAINQLSTEVQQDRPFSRQNEFRFSVKELKDKLNTVESQLSEERERLEKLKSTSHAFAELMLEAVWVREKLLQLERLPSTGTIDLTRTSLMGQKLLGLQRLRRQVRSHLLEAENRRPRMKRLLEDVERTYCTEKYAGVGVNVKRFQDTIGEIRGGWATLDLELERWRREAESGEMVCQFALDAAEIEAWISEQELYMLTAEKPKDEQAALSSLRKHRVRAATIDRWLKQITWLQNRGQNLRSQLEKLYSEPPKPSVDAKVHNYLQLIQNCLSRIDYASKHLHRIAREKMSNLETTVTKHRLLREVADLEAWIAEKSKVAVSHELGSDLDHCSALRDRFSNFIKLTVPDGSNRVSTVSTQCVRLITQGHPDAPEIASAKDSVNEAWADLLELIETRKQLLKAAWDMHHFVNDCQDIEERITCRMGNLPPVPSEALITGKKQGLSGCQRAQACLEQELQCLAEQVNRLSATTRRLLPRYAGVQAEQLQGRHDRVQAIWQRLGAVAEARNGMLKSAARIHRFLVVARELIMWLEGARDQMETKERPRDVLGVEFLIKEHTALHNEIEARADNFETCLNLGREILAEQPVLSTESMPAKDPLAGPRSEVRERCVQLATGHLLVKELWRERWDRLHLLLEVRQFARDANSAEVWLAGKELQLETARRQLGDTLSETLMLLGAHYAFQQTLVSANERFNALKRLTTLEIRAMEWNPQEATLREQEKRDKVREVVKEFLPNYVPSKATVPVSTHPTKSGLLKMSHMDTHAPKPTSTASALGTATVVTEPSGKPSWQHKEQFRPEVKPSSTAVESKSIPVETVKRKVATAQMVLSRPKEAESELTPKNGQNGGPTQKPTVMLQQLSGSVVQSNEADRPILRATTDRDSASQMPPVEHRMSRQPSIESARQITLSPQQARSSLEESGAGHQYERDKEASAATYSETSVPSPTSSFASSSKAVPTQSIAGAPVPQAVERHSDQSEMSSASQPQRRSTVGSTELSAQIQRSSTELAEHITQNAPRLEGPVVRKQEFDVGGTVRPRSAGRSWIPVYLVLDSGQLRVYKDYRSRRQKPEEYLRNETPISLVFAQAIVAADYTKRPCVFRLHLNDGRQYLFQTANDRVMQRWLDAINEAAQLVTAAQPHSSRPSIASMGAVGSRVGSVRYDSQSSMAQRRSLKSFFSLRRKS